jgi:hypothetical protein
MLFISESNWTPMADDNWTSSDDRSCAVLLTARASFVAESKGSGRGFAWIQCGGVRINNCYNSRNDTTDKYMSFLGDLEHSVKSTPHGLNVVIGGVFNAWSTQWGSASNDLRGERLADLAASLDLNPSNLGNKHTYR